MHKQLFSQSKTILLQLYLIHLLLHVRPEFKSIFVLNFASVFCVFLMQKKKHSYWKRKQQKKTALSSIAFSQRQSVTWSPTKGPRGPVESDVQVWIRLFTRSVYKVRLTGRATKAGGTTKGSQTRRQRAVQSDAPSAEAWRLTTDTCGCPKIATALNS